MPPALGRCKNTFESQKYAGRCCDTRERNIYTEMNTAKGQTNARSDSGSRIVQNLNEIQITITKYAMKL